MPTAYAPMGRLFRPDSVALVGASTRPGTIASRLLACLRTSPAPPSIHLVHPTATDIDGLPVAGSIADIVPRPDVAIVAVRRDRAVGVVQEAARVGVPFVVVVSSGFEVGEEGRAARSELLAVLRGTGTRLVGPNTEGLAFLDTGMALTFNPVIGRRSWPAVDLTASRSGGVMVVSQSGALAFAALDCLDAAGVQTRAVVSTGDELDIDAADFMRYACTELRCRAVVLILESFQPVERFLEVCALARSSHTAVITLQLGVSEAGLYAVASHTGRAVTNHVVAKAVVRKAGAIPIRNLEDLGPVAAAIVTQPSLRAMTGTRVVVVSAAGGPAILVADQLSEVGLTVEPLPGPVQASIVGLLPPFAAIRNPVDVTAQVGFDDPMREVIELVTSSERVDGVVLVGSFQHRSLGSPEWQSTLRQHRKPLVAWCYSGPSDENRAVFMVAGVPWSSTARGAALAMAAALQVHGGKLRSPVRAGGSALMGERRAPTSYPEAEDSLAAAGLAVSKRLVLRNELEAAQSVAKLAGPVVMKIMTDEFLPKTDIGGVVSGLRSRADRIEAFRDLTTIATTHDLPPWTISLQPQASGHEMLLGAMNYPDVGVLLGIGSGGTLANVIDDASFYLAPLSTQDRHDWVRELPVVRRILRGYREHGPVPSHVVTETINRFFEWVEDLAPDTWSVIELNPVIVGPEVATIVDIRITVANRVGDPAREAMSAHE